MNEQLTTIREAIEEEIKKVYFLHNSDIPGAELRMILGRLEALRALEREILFKVL